MTTPELLKAVYAGSHRAAELSTASFGRNPIHYKGAELFELLQVLRQATAAAVQLDNRSRGLPEVEKTK